MKTLISKIASVIRTCVLILGVAVPSYAQSSERLDGIWTNGENTRKAEIYLQGGGYYGKITWAADDGKAKPGEVVFRDLKRSGSAFKGIAITPQGDLQCTITFENEAKIKITVSKGFLSKTVYWERVRA